MFPSLCFSIHSVLKPEPQNYAGVSLLDYTDLSQNFIFFGHILSYPRLPSALICCSVDSLGCGRTCLTVLLELTRSVLGGFNHPSHPAETFCDHMLAAAGATNIDPNLVEELHLMLLILFPEPGGASARCWWTFCW